MANYQKMYTTLFNAITDAINILQNAQQSAEELYMSAEQPSLSILQKYDADSDVDSNN